jgi:hypothetical protein
VNQSIKAPIKDKVTLEQYKAYNYATACEDCTHFDLQTETCTFTFPTEPFRRAYQIKDVETNGEAAFCRAIEID